MATVSAEEARPDTEHERCPGDDKMLASVYGESVDDLKTAALERGEALFGPGVPLEVEKVLQMQTSATFHGSFWAQIVVRRTDGDDDE